jgi:hypothetical protein
MPKLVAASVTANNIEDSDYNAETSTKLIAQTDAIRLPNKFVAQ